MDKIKALADYLGVPESYVTPSVDYSYDENYFDVNETDTEDKYFLGTYLVVDDREADKLFKDDLESLIYDVGLEGINFDYIGGIEDYVDVDWFNDAMRESYENYAYDIMDDSSDDYSSRLLEEMVDANVVSDDDLIDIGGKLGFDPNGETDENDFIGEFVDHLCDGWTNGVEWYIKEIGDCSDIAIEHNLVNIEDLAEAIKLNDGRGSLATYDGDELELDGDLYAYRVE